MFLVSCELDKETASDYGRGGGAQVTTWRDKGD